MVRRHVTVHGRVQNVWFRDSCRQQAEAKGVSGFVRNRADGTVEAEFEGEPAAVEAMVRWCHKGPELASVEHVEVNDLEVTGQLGFSVR